MEKIQKIPKKTYNYNTITSNTGGIQRKDEKIHMKTTDTVTGLLTSQGNVSFICQNVTQQVFADNLNFCCHVNQPLIAVNLSKPIMPPQYSDMSDNMPIQCHLLTLGGL